MSFIFSALGDAEDMGHIWHIVTQKDKIVEIFTTEGTRSPQKARVHLTSGVSLLLNPRSEIRDHVEENAHNIHHCAVH